MNKFTRMASTAILAGLLGSGAAWAQQPAAPSSAAAAGNPDSSFVTQAATSGMMEVETSKMAEKQAKDSKVKSFAKEMVKDHTKANDKLKKLAKSKGLTLPDDTAAKAAADQLKDKKGHDFDLAYLQAAGPDAHQQAVTLFEQEANSGQDQQLRAFAKETLPTLQHHLKEAQDLQKRVEK
ncbi:MAG: DUF4142 domain-containing protein [Burkholderiaceae bacterium]